MAEQFYADHLAGAGIDGGAHQRRLENAHAVVDGERPEQHGERRGGHDDWNAEAHAVEELAEAGRCGDCFGGHCSFRKGGLFRSGHPTCHTNSLEPVISEGDA